MDLEPKAEEVSKLGKYALVAEIARGGMGVVYLGMAQGPAGFSKLVAIKALKREFFQDPTFLEMFHNEARLAARLHHRNLVQTYEIGADGAQHFIVMEYLEGVALSRILRMGDPRFTTPLHLRVVCEMLQGLHCAHTLEDFDGKPLGIVHRDASPQNVFVTFDGQVKVIDFGIAKAFDSARQTGAGVLKGKLRYMAPEQIGADTDARADVFAAGVMIWEAVAKQRMWRETPEVEVLANVLRGTMPALRDFAPSAPAALVSIVDKALKADPDERYATAAELRSDLESYLASAHHDVSSLDVGSVVAEMFDDERTKTRSLIEAHLLRVQAGSPPSKLPSLRPPAPENADSATAKRPPESAMPSGVSTDTAASASDPPAGKTVQLSVALFTFLLVGVALGRLLAVEGPSESTGSTKSREPSVSSALPLALSGAAKPSTHRLFVRAMASNATLTIDGATMSNPAEHTCTHGSTVNVHLVAPGYVPRDRTWTCERDESFELELAPVPPAPVRAPPPPIYGRVRTSPLRVPLPPNPYPSLGAPPAREDRPSRPIETANPY